MATCKQEPSPSTPPPPENDLTKASHYAVPTYTDFLLNWQTTKIHGGWEDSSLATSSCCYFCSESTNYFLPPIGNVILLFSSLSPQISIGQIVMANYNPDEPDERGYWYDFKITKKVLRK